MKSFPWRFPLLSVPVSLLASVMSVAALDIPLGGIGGVGDIIPGTGLVSVSSVIAGGPGAVAGLQPGDLIQGADGVMFSITSTDSGNGYIGAIQDLAMAVDRAEGNGGALNLQVIRSGVGGLNVSLALGSAGSLGPAWPANTGKTAAMFEWSCDQIHSRVLGSSTANFGYNSGWFGMILLSHPNWNQTSGPKPFRNSINKLRTRCENYINGRILEPAEAFYWDGTDVIANPAYVSPGLENWDVTTSAMFLALYRSKTGDTTTDPVVQRSAEAIAHRIQHWVQYDDPGIPHVIGGGIGRMGHGGVHGDYSHYNGTGALNIINAHALPALALLRNAGANMNTNLGHSINAFTYNPGLIQPTIEQKFRICWDYVKAATSVSGNDDGNVGYMGRQSGWDSAGRTPGCFAGWKLYGMAANSDDDDKAARQADYFTRRWFRQQNAHAYTLGGVALSQLAMPFLDDRRERFFQENTRLFPALARRPNGTIAYFPGRQNNGGDGYLNFSDVALINAAIPVAVRTGNLPGFPVPNPARIHAWMRSPVNSWPAIEARRVVLRGGLSHSLDLDITDVDGAILAPNVYTATWSHVSGPSTVRFSAPSSVDTSVTVSQAGTYRVNLQVTRNSYVLNEAYDLVVTTETPPAEVAPYVVAQPMDLTVDQGASATFTVIAQGTGPLIYQWRRNGLLVGPASISPSFTIASVAAGSAGEYDCVITNAFGTITSSAATLTVTGVGTFRWGGLWRDVFTGMSGSYVSNMTSSTKYPSFPDAGGAIPTAETPTDYADNYGQRLSGWITPPQTGNYRFYIASDDESELWLSTDGTRANRRRIARVSDGNDSNGSWWTSPRQWNRYPNQTSAQISLMRGQRYYIEVLHKEGGGGDNLAVTWDWKSTGVWSTPANGSDPLPGAVLEYQEGGTLDDLVQPPTNYAPIANSQALVVFGGAFATITLTALDFEQAPLTYTVLGNPTKGTLSGTEPNLVYVPFPGASGTDSFTFIANDGLLNSEPATVTLALVPESGSDLKVWNGAADDLWATAANWNANEVPDSNDVIIFNGDSLSNLAISLAGNRTVARMVVLDPAGPVSIADNTLTLSSGIEMFPAAADLSLSSGVRVSAAQEWSVGANRTLRVSGALAGSTTLTKTGPGTLEFAAVGNMSGGIVVNEGTLRLSGGGWYAGHVGGSGMVTVNQGATAINVNAHSFGSGNDPNRDVTLNRGSFLLGGETYVDDVWSTAGTIGNIVGGQGDLRARSGNNSILTVNAADLPTVVSCSLNAVGTWSLNVADGAASHDLFVSGVLAGGSAITKTGAGRMLVSSISNHSGAFNLNAGELAVTGSLAAGSALTVQAGATLSGTGSVLGTVTQNGILSPGVDAIAVLSVGVLNQGSASTTRITLNGSAAGSGYDQVQVTGAANLAGTLQVSLAPGYLPPVGVVFDVIMSASRTGTYHTVSLPALPPDRAWLSAYDGGPTPGLRLAVEAVAPPEFALTYMAGVNGSISGTTPQIVVQGGNGSTMTAIPGTGYHFVSWSDGMLTAERTDMNVLADLSVTASFGLSAYEQWIQSFPSLTDPGDRLPSADPDGDGLANSIEFVTGSDPSQATPGMVLSCSVDATNVVFAFMRSKVAQEAGFTSLVEISSDLTGSLWTEVGGDAVDIADHGANETVTVTVPRGTGGRLFGRLRVISP